VVASKNIQTYKYGEKQQKAKEKTASKCRLYYAVYICLYENFHARAGDKAM